MSLTYEEKIPDVLAGICDSTLRPQVGMSRGRKIGKRSKRQVGDQLLLHGWKGVPYRSAWSFKVLAEIYKMMPALISYRGAVIRSDEGMINYQWEELDWLAKIDGIRPATGLQMRNVFCRMYTPAHLEPGIWFDWIRFKLIKEASP
jgi:hypothetical protein